MNVLIPLSSSAITTNERILSLGRLPNVRRPKLISLERRQRNRERFKQLLNEPTDEDILASQTTKYHRKWLMRIWVK